jgi:protease I
MAKMLLMIENGFEDAEVIYPFYRMQEAGYEIDVVGPAKGETYKGKYGYPVTANTDPSEVNIRDYVTLLIPGGQAPDKMRLNDGLVDLVKAADREGLVVAAICHGPQMLIEADIVRGRNATCYRSVLTDILNAGAIYHDLPVITDGNMITSRAPKDLPEFCRQILIVITAALEEDCNGSC